MPESAMWAVVPLKSCDTAKSRLRPLLDPYERKRLYLAMARHVLLTLQAVPGVDGVAVVTRDAEIAGIAEHLQARILRQDADAGMAHACRFAVERLRMHRPGSLLMISGDLPLISVRSVSRFVQAAEHPPCAPAIAIAPDRHRTGTNALLCASPDAIPICFGPGSFTMHLAAALARSVSVEIIDAPDLALDIDTPDDLRLLRSVLASDPESLSRELQAILAVHPAVAGRA
jgi:2-phospho-L-lactate guanylyltransferase